MKTKKKKKKMQCWLCPEADAAVAVPAAEFGPRQLRSRSRNFLLLRKNVKMKMWPSQRWLVVVVEVVCVLAKNSLLLLHEFVRTVVVDAGYYRFV